MEELEYPVNFQDCVKMFQNDQSYTTTCQNCKQDTLHAKLNYIDKFPKYLLVNMKNIVVNGWVPRKLHALLQFSPDEIDFSDLAFRTMDNEKFIQEKMDEENLGQEPAFQVDEMALMQLTSMGFTVNRATRALAETGGNVDNALNLIFSTIDDQTWDEPYNPNKPKAGGNGGQDKNAEAEALVEQVWPMLEGMGIPKELIYAAAEVKVTFL